MEPCSTTNESKPALKDRFEDVFGGLAALEAKHDAFVKSELKGRQQNWKNDPSLEEAVDQKRSRDRNTDETRHRTAFSRRNLAGTSQHHESGGGKYRGERHNRSRGQGRGRMPDYKAHPDKWVRYDLSDVDNSQLSEQANTSAAFSFLSELRQRKQVEEDPDVGQGRDDITGNPPPGSVVFKKPLQRHSMRSKTTTSSVEMQQSNESETSQNICSTDIGTTQSSDKILFKKPKVEFGEDSMEFPQASTLCYRAGALVMPEHVIGTKPPTTKARTKKVKTTNVESKAVVKLSYFKDEEGEDSDGVGAGGEEKFSGSGDFVQSGDNGHTFVGNTKRREKRHIRKEKGSDNDMND